MTGTAGTDAPHGAADGAAGGGRPRRFDFRYGDMMWAFSLYVGGFMVVGTIAGGDGGGALWAGNWGGIIPAMSWLIGVPMARASRGAHGRR